jgi:hypothetical protein
MTEQPNKPTLASVEADLFGAIFGFHKKTMTLLRQSSLDDEKLNVVADRIKTLLDAVTAEVKGTISSALYPHNGGHWLSIPSRSMCRTLLSFTLKNRTTKLRDWSTVIWRSWALTRAKKISLRRWSESCSGVFSWIMNNSSGKYIP